MKADLTQRGVGRRAGFTLPELMIATAISVMVVASLLATFVQQRRAYKAVQMINEMNQNVRTALDAVTRDLRSAGYGVNVKSGTMPTWFNWVSGVTVTGVVTVVQGGSGAPDTLHVVGAFNDPVATLSTSSSVGSTSIRVQSGQGSQFNTTAKRVIFVGKTETARITGIAGDVLSVSTDPSSTAGLKYAYPAGTSVELVNIVTFSWLNDPYTYPGEPHLRRYDNSGSMIYEWQKILASDIEDFQIAGVGKNFTVTVTGRADERDPRYLHPTKGDRYRRITLSADCTVRKPEGT